VTGIKKLTADIRGCIVFAVSALFFLITDFSSITETAAGSHRRFVYQQHGSIWDAKQEGLVFERQTPSPTMRYSVPWNSKKMDNAIGPTGFRLIYWISN
jgi:hypothetical protein